jgi:hypothetical protein
MTRPLTAVSGVKAAMAFDEDEGARDLALAGVALQDEAAEPAHRRRAILPGRDAAHGRVTRGSSATSGLSAVGCRLSAVGCRLSAVGHRAISHQPTAHSPQPPTAHSPWHTADGPPPSHPATPGHHRRIPCQW